MNVFQALFVILAILFFLDNLLFICYDKRMVKEILPRTERFGAIVSSSFRDTEKVSTTGCFFGLKSPLWSGSLECMFRLILS